MKQLLLIFVAGTFLLQALLSQAQVEGVEYDWKRRLDKSGIQIYTSKVAGSAFKATRAVMVVDASPASLVALVMDLENCKTWAKSCKKAYILKSFSSTENYVYSIANAPFPIKSRDMIGHVTWKIDSQTGKVSATGRAKPDAMEPQKGLVRVQHADSNWHFTPLPDGKTRVENYTHVDPNGPIPAFLVNLLLVGTPYKSLKGMRKRLSEGLYDDAELPF